MTHQEITNLLQTEMVPALGCTGPTAYALAAACCRPYLTAASEQIRIYVSPAFLKIGFGVATQINWSTVGSFRSCVTGKRKEFMFGQR